MKYLCICEGGNVRSRALAFYLRYVHKREAIAIGWRYTTKSTMKMLCGWADYVVLMEPYMIKYIPDNFREKVRVLDVGQDRWGIYIPPDLNMMVTQGAGWLVGQEPINEFDFEFGTQIKTAEEIYDRE